MSPSKLFEKKFWGSPELIETLLPFLDLESTKQLALSHLRTREILQTTLDWNRLVRRSCPKNVPAVFQEKVDAVKHLVAILELMEEPKDLMLDLLDEICRKFPGAEVRIICPRHPDGHLLTWDGFLLLEEVEGAFGTAEQSLGWVGSQLKEEPILEGVLGTALQRRESVELRRPYLQQPLLSAIGSRVNRQQEKVSYEVAYVHIEDKASLESFDALMQACSKISGMMLKISSAIGREGWETLTRTLQHQPEMKTMVRISKSVLDEERLEDLNEFLAALGPSVTFCVSSRLSCLGMLIRNEGDPLLRADSFRLELGQIKDMSQDNWDGFFQFEFYLKFCIYI